MRTPCRVALFLMVFGAGCAPVVVAPEVPDWLQQWIADIESEPVTNPPSRIVRYQYLGQTVYYRPPRCCDFPSTLLDSSGTLMCSPDGGITGGGDGRCPDFFASRSAEHVVWRDPRP